MKRKKPQLSTILMVVALIVGLGLLAYPSFADYWNSFTQSRAIFGYAEAVAELDTETYQRIWNEALEYNRRLSERGMLWSMPAERREEYNSTLDPIGTGNMGYIDIPKINVSLPVYHGVEDHTLLTSIGHLEQTSLPVGSTYAEDDQLTVTTPLNPSHSVVSGHRGLPSARLFSDLDQLEAGDVFYLTILDQTLTYEVDQIRIVEPTDLSELVLVEGMDLCTLVTCTPYGINTHRMLVRGHRIENEKKTNIRIIADAIMIDSMFVAPVIALPVLILMIILMLIITGNRRRRKAEAKAEADAQRSKEVAMERDPNRPTPADILFRSAYTEAALRAQEAAEAAERGEEVERSDDDDDDFNFDF